VLGGELSAWKKGRGRFSDSRTRDDRRSIISKTWESMPPLKGKSRVEKKEKAIGERGGGGNYFSFKVLQPRKKFEHRKKKRRKSNTKGLGAVP